MARDRYEETLAWLLGLEAARGMDFKLERVGRALDAVGAPHRALRTIHVAGTNGKGSVAAMAEAILRAAGMRTGLYTSPHLVDFRERIRIGETWIAPDAVVEHVERIRASVDVVATGLTFFELTTIVAFMQFAAAKVDAAVVEVGLGGRLDATNVLVGDVCVITSIGFDHEAFLGNTLAAIAGEKAGILEAGRPAIIGRLPSEARSVVEARAGGLGCPMLRLGEEIHVAIDAQGVAYVGPRRRLEALRPALRGAHQVDNAALAIAAADELEGGSVADEAVRVGLASVAWPGRLQVLGRNPWIAVDAAHNPEGARTLARELDALVEGRRVHLLFGVLGDKRWPEMVDALAPRVARATVVRVPVARSAEPDVVARRFAEYCRVDVAEDPVAAAKRALDGVVGGEALVVAGSVFLIGALLPFLQARVRGNESDANDDGESTVRTG